MASMNKRVPVKTSQNKTVEYKQQGNLAFQLLVKSQAEDVNLDLKDLMSYQLTPVPYSIATADNFLAKTDKTKAFHHITKEVCDADVPPNETTLTVIVGNALFYYMQQLPANFSQICLMVFDMIPKNTDVVFSTDTYKEDSIKPMEGQW